MIYVNGSTFIFLRYVACFVLFIALNKTLIELLFFVRGCIYDPFEEINSLKSLTK